MNKGKDGLYRSSFYWHGKTYTVAGKSEAEVHRKIGRKRAELEAGTAIRKKAVTVRQYALEWISAYNKGDYESVVNNHIVPDLGDLLLRDVTEARLQSWLNKKGEEYSWSYVSKMKMTVCQIFHKARKNHLINDDPAEDLEMPDCRKGSRRALTDDETALLLRVTESHRGRLFVRCMLYCGLRPQEAAVLQWKHVDLDKRTIHIEQARKRKDGLVGLPKTDAGNRYIQIPNVLLNALRPQVSAPEDYVCSWDNKPITQQQEKLMWASILRAMDIAAGAKVYRNQIVESVIADDLVLYCLRHTCCTNWQKAGVPLNVAKEWMGHSDISVTANIYTHASSEASEAAVALVDAMTPVVRDENGILFTENARFASKHQ